MTRTQQFIEKNKKVLTSGPDFFNPDTSLMSVDKFEKSKCKILLILPTPHVVKTVSSTVAAINDYIIEHCPDTFLDVAYMPENEDIKRYDEWNVPYAIGNITHLDPSHFDVIGFSISVLSEIVTTPVIMSTFSRCDKPIPLFWSQRKDTKLGEYPIIYGGGITAVCGESMFGKVNVRGKEEQAYLDFLYLGDCGQTNIMTSRLIEAIETGKCTRHQSDHDVPGYEHVDIENFVEDYKVETIQDYIECLFDLQEIYHPQAYEVEYNEHNQIIKNIKINPKARDFVSPYYPHIMAKDLGIGRAVINGNGDGTGTAQVQVSEGAHMKGNRIRTQNGLVRVEELCSKEVGDSECSGTVDTIDGPGKLYHRFTQGVKPVIIFTLKSGIRIGLTVEHPVEQWHIGDERSEFVRADSLNVGDFFMTKKSHVFGSYPMTPDEAEFLGRMVGDGSYNLYRDSREGHDTPVHRMYLSCAWSEKEYCEDLLNRAGINYTLDETQGRHCRFWIKETDKKGRSMREFWGFNEFYKEREGKPSVKYIPSPAYKLTEEAMKAFLKGYHDADGCTSTKQGLSKVTFDCCHESIIDDIQQFLLMVGIPSRKHFNEKSRIADEEYGFYDTVNEHWSLIISSEYFDKFNELGVLKRAFGRSTRSKEHLPIPTNIRELLYNTSLSTEERARAFAQVRRNSFTKALADKCGFEYPDVVFDEIVKIEFSEAETYDLSVYKLEKLTANGCSVHNCSAAGCCSFCAEGNYTGGWVEKDEEQILWELREAKKYSAGYKFKPYSFNANYVTDYKGKLAKFIGIYPKVTFINMRMEELGRDTDALKMMKLIGSNRISAPMEGLSPRIQNNLLNKCLSEEALQNFMDDMVHAKMTDIKVGGIFTGYEEDEDFQWICDFVDKFKERAAKEGGNFPFRLKCCLTREALTPFPGKGLLRQDDFPSKGFIEGYEKSEVKELKPQGLCTIMKVTTKDGTELRGTYEHPLLVDYKRPDEVTSYKFFKDLKSGDKVYGKLGTHAYGGMSQSLELVDWPDESSKQILICEFIAKILGWYMGRGFLSDCDAFKSVTLPFYPNEEEEAQEICNYLNSLGFLSEIKAYPLAGLSTLKIKDARFSRTIFKEFGSKDEDKRISSLILKSPFMVQRNFIKYWFKSSITGDRLVMRNKSVLQDLKAMLANMGVLTNLRKLDVGLSQHNVYDWILEVDDRWVVIFNKLMSDQCKVSYSFTNISNSLLKDGYYEFEVDSVEVDGLEETFGVTTSSGTYITNGIVSHNTPLVHYPLTPIEYLERKSARASYNGEHWLTDEWYEKFREHQVFFKVNGFRYSTFLEQTFVDLGRSLTPLIYKHFIDNLVPVYSLRSCATEEYLKDLRELVDEKVYFEDRDPEHYISPSHRVHIELMGSYIPRARRILRHKKAGNIFANEPDTRCLRTYENAPVKCYHNCIIKDPLKVYYDVTLDSEGNLQGKFYNLNGCERCQSVEQRKKRLLRDVNQTKNSEDIIATPRIPQVQKIRFVIKRLPEFDCLNPNNTAHTFITKFLQLSDNLLDSYHSVVGHNMFWQAEPGFKFYASGYQIVDTMWSKNVIKEVKELISEVNKNLKSIQIVSAQDILRDEKISITDLNFYTFESTIPREVFDSACHTYKGQIKVEAQVQGFALTEVIDSSLEKPVFASKGGKTVGCFWIPAKYNPVMFLSGFLSQAKKTSEDGVVTTTDFCCMMTMRENKMTCKNCQNEKALISVTTGKPMSFGKSCMCKAILTQIINK